MGWLCRCLHPSVSRLVSVRRTVPYRTSSDGSRSFLYKTQGYKEDFVFEELEAAIELYEKHEEEDK